MEKLIERVSEEVRNLSSKEVFDYSDWQKLIKQSIREFLMIEFNLKRNPSAKKQCSLVDRLGKEQTEELSKIINGIEAAMMGSMASSKYIKLYGKKR